MKTQPALTLIATAIALSLPVALAPQTHAATVVAPNQTANAGISTALNNGNRTYLMQYGASLLSGINVGDQITGLTFRISSGRQTHLLRQPVLLIGISPLPKLPIRFLA